VRVHEVMSSPAVTVRPHTPIGQVAALLVSRGFTAVPVVDAEGRLHGLVTEADLMGDRIAPDGVVSEGPGVGAPEPLASAVMRAHPTCVDHEADLADVANLMLASRTRSVPVVRNGKIIGMVTARDVLKVVAAGSVAEPARH
jgi:CBS domain-containing protein